MDILFSLPAIFMKMYGSYIQGVWMNIYVHSHLKAPSYSCKWSPLSYQRIPHIAIHVIHKHEFNKGKRYLLSSI